LVAQLATILENPAEVRRLYEGLDNLGRSAIQEAVHDPHGICQHDRFAAKYGYFPLLSLSGSSDYRKKPTPLRLFFLGGPRLTDI